MLMQRLFAGLTENVDTPLRAISSLAEEAAVAHAWPGNVRELRNRLERAIALASGEWLMPGDLFPERRRPPASNGEGVQRLSAARDAADCNACSLARCASSGRTVWSIWSVGHAVMPASHCPRIAEAVRSP